jgi:colicin import membrane protein
MKTKTTSVVTVEHFDTEALLTRVRGVEDNASVVEGGRKGVMETLAAEFGAPALMTAKAGGINCAAFRKGTKDETKKAEASRLGMPTGKARQLADIVNGINAIRANVWQEYQRSYFGRKPTKATEPATLTAEAKAANAAKAEAKEAKTQVDLARAALIVASVEKKGVAEAKANLEEKKAEAEQAKAKAEDAKAKAVAKATESKEAKASESLSDLIQRAIDMAEKTGKANVMDLLTEALERL